MTTILVAEPIETLAVSFLRARFDPIPAATRRPNPMPTDFIRVTRTGGFRSSLVLDTAQLLLEVWSATDADAEDLALKVQATWLGWAGLAAGHGIIYDTAADAPVPLPDPDTGRVRYTIVVSVTTQSRLDV